jgi:hypothetical protein
VWASVVEADRLGARSVAVPPVSGDIYRGPMTVAEIADAIVAGSTSALRGTVGLDTVVLTAWIPDKTPWDAAYAKALLASSATVDADPDQVAREAEWQRRGVSLARGVVLRNRPIRDMFDCMHSSTSR